MGINKKHLVLLSFFLVIAIVYAVEQKSLVNINMMQNSIYNATWMNATYFNGSGQYLTNIPSISNTTSEIINAINSSGSYNITSWFSNYVSNTTERALFTLTFNSTYDTYVISNVSNVAQFCNYIQNSTERGLFVSTYNLTYASFISANVSSVSNNTLWFNGKPTSFFQNGTEQVNTTAQIFAVCNNGTFQTGVEQVNTTNEIFSVVNNNTFSTIIRYINKTGLTYNGSIVNGSLVGYQAAHRICNLTFSNSHFCTFDEINQYIRNNQQSLPSDFTSFAWHSQGGAKYVPATYPVNDCNGWVSDSSSYVGNFWKFNTTGGGSSAAMTCDDEKSLACCT